MKAWLANLCRRSKALECGPSADGLPLSACELARGFFHREHPYQPGNGRVKGEIPAQPASRLGKKRQQAAALQSFAPYARGAGLKPGATSATTALLLVLVFAAGLATSCRQNHAAVPPDPLARAYDSEADWNDATHVIPLNYQQAQGKRVFYQYCVWCHADSTPAGPSNRSNLNPNPPLANDGATLNALSDDFMRNVITLGGAAAGKSASMPPWGKTLSQDDIEAVIAFYRAIAQPPYQPPARPGPKYSVR